MKNEKLVVVYIYWREDIKMKKTQIIGTIVSASAPLLIYGAVSNHIYAEEVNPNSTIQTEEITTIKEEDTISSEVENASIQQEESTEDSKNEIIENKSEKKDSTNTSNENSISSIASYSGTSNSSNSQATYANVSYQVHVQDYGWMSASSNGEQAGTTGQSKRLEGIIVNVDSNLSGSIEYSAHIQDIGWQEWKSAGQLAGTTGQGKRIEAIRFRLTGDLANTYHINYQSYIQNHGWLLATMDGGYSGSQGLGLRIEAIHIWISTGGATAGGSFICPNIQYKTHVQDIGWQGTTNEGEIAGTTGQGKRVEALSISLSNPELSGNIEYRTHIQNIGWESNWHKNGEVAGSIGQSLRVEALQVRLTGDVSNRYDIAYRVHVQDYGWLGWALNGTMTGSSQLSKRIEAIEIKLIEKGTTLSSTRMNYVDKLNNYYISGNIDPVWTQTSSGKWKYTGSSTVTDNWVVIGNTKAYRLNSDGTMVKTSSQTPAMYESECLSVNTVLANKNYYLNKNIQIIGCSGQNNNVDSQGKTRPTIWTNDGSSNKYILLSKNNKAPIGYMKTFLISGKFKYENGDYVLDADSITVVKSSLAYAFFPSQIGSEHKLVLQI